MYSESTCQMGREKRHSQLKFAAYGKSKPSALTLPSCTYTSHHISPSIHPPISLPPPFFFAHPQPITITDRSERCRVVSNARALIVLSHVLWITAHQCIGGFIPCPHQTVFEKQMIACTTATHSAAHSEAGRSHTNKQPPHTTCMQQT